MTCVDRTYKFHFLFLFRLRYETATITVLDSPFNRDTINLMSLIDTLIVFPYVKSIVSYDISLYRVEKSKRVIHSLSNNVICIFFKKRTTLYRRHTRILNLSQSVCLYSFPLHSHAHTVTVRLH